jgi:uncharacterized protein with gpF-like domain
MVNRRSLGDAMDITPEKMAFIKGQGTKSVEQTATDQPADSPEPVKAIELGVQDSSEETAPRRPARKRQTIQAPEASDVLDQVLVPVTLRLQHKTSQALKRAYLEQKLKHAKPDTIQEIGEEAIKDWLFRAGFLS